MRIDVLQGQLTHLATDTSAKQVGTQPASAGGGQAKPAPAPAHGENVTVSEAAKGLAAKAAAASSATKVAQLSQAVQSGTFKVDPKLIAQRMVDRG